MKFSTARFFRFCPALIFIVAFLLGSQQQHTIDDAPGPLSPVHREAPGLKNCTQCHSDELAVVLQKCLACHQEIAARLSENRGFHRDKAADCAVCHTEHGGEETKLVDWDVQQFDHEETGYSLLGKHKNVRDCLSCHKKENSFPRKTTLSYLLKDSRCLACHKSPHPGRQDSCQVCHSQTHWRVDIWERETR